MELRVGLNAGLNVGLNVGLGVESNWGIEKGSGGTECSEFVRGYILTGLQFSHARVDSSDSVNLTLGFSFIDQDVGSNGMEYVSAMSVG